MESKLAYFYCAARKLIQVGFKGRQFSARELVIDGTISHLTRPQTAK
ncbi:MAG: hypothetical protein R8K20_07835 [Gallionellaceae bacterium]